MSKLNNLSKYYIFEEDFNSKLKPCSTKILNKHIIQKYNEPIQI